MKKQETYVGKYVKQIQERINKIGSGRPPFQLVYDNISDLIDQIYDDGYKDGSNGK